ncbi:MAG: hypothetical protein KF901_21430 [Myxococcales bacterium]|nr:hypothetical protein [Myxococcales bacterium]
MTGAPFEELERGSAVAYGACGGIWVMTLFSEPTTADMSLARHALQKMVRRQPAGFPSLTWILPQAGYSMSSEARKEAADVTNEFDRHLRAQGVLIDASGFQAATVRAIVTGLHFLSRTTSPKKVFSELGPAVSWCASHRPPEQGEPDLRVTSSLAAMRSRLDRGS